MAQVLALPWAAGKVAGGSHNGREALSLGLARLHTREGSLCVLLVTARPE